MDICKLAQKIHLQEDKLKLCYDIAGLENAYTLGVDSLFEYAETIAESERYPMMLQFCLKKVVDTYAAYKERGIDEQIYFDTMGDITVWVDNCERDTGIYGLREYRWIINHIELKLVRLGRLQFEPTTLQTNTVCGGRTLLKGSRILAVHVPQGEPLRYADCKKSYAMAVNFYKTEWFCCDSWLLSPELKKVLPPESNILQFQSDYFIGRAYDSRQCEERIFLKLEENPGNYKAVTSLQKGVKSLMLMGGKIGGGTGMFCIKDDNQFITSGERQYELMHRLDYVRVVGTAGEAKAMEVIIDELNAFGVDSRIETFDFDSYEVKEARFEITEPYHKSYNVTGYGLTGNGHIEAELYYAEDCDDISLSFAKDKLVLINGSATAVIYKKLVKAGALGFITISGTPLDEIDKTDLEVRAIRPSRHLSGGVKKIPGVTMRYNDVVDILEKGGTKARLTLTQNEGIGQGKNIIADIKGTGDTDETIVFMAHYDSVPFSPGAYDNSSGAVIIMEMCQYFKEHPPLRNVRFAWFSGEEIGLVGSKAYVKQHESELSNIVLGVNVDLAGHIVGAHSISVTGDMSILNALEYQAKTLGIGMRFVQEVCSSDSSSFSDGGIPTVSLRRSGFGGHNRHDTFSLVSAKSLQQTAAILCILGEKIVNSPVFPFVREMPQNMKDLLAKYFGRE